MAGHPEVFYKYLSVAGAENVLESGRLRWSSPLLFDDPAEFRRMPRFEPLLADAGRVFTQTLVDAARGHFQLEEERLSKTTKLLLDLIRLLVKRGVSCEEMLQQLGRMPPHSDERFEIALNRFVEQLTLDSTRVLCVTTEGDNPAMWERYAEESRGAVLSFRHLPELSTPLLAARCIRYSQDPPVVGSGLDFLLYGDTQGLRERSVEAICYTKKVEWSYQHEWRAMTWRSEERGRLYGDYPFLDAELVSVTVGARASTKWISAISDLVTSRYPTCRLYGRERRETP